MPPDQKTSWLVRLRQAAKASRERRTRREPQPPWLVQHCPQRLRKVVIGFYKFMGLFSMLLIVFAGLAGFISAPLMYAHSQDRSLIADWVRQYLHWLHEHFSQDNFGPAYCIIQACIAGVALYFMTAFKWVSKKSKQDESDVA